MAEITAKLVKELREKSGVYDGCQEGVGRNNATWKRADWLRTKGLAKAAKKADRVAAEGLAAITLLVQALLLSK